MIVEAFSTFAGLAALLVVLEENSRNKRLQVHQVLVEVPRPRPPRSLHPDRTLPVSRRKDIDARTVFCHTNQQIMRMPRLTVTRMQSCRLSHLPGWFCPEEVQA